MPRYFFHFVSRDRVIRDSKGVDLQGLEAAHWHAVRMAYQMRYYFPDDNVDWVIEIEDMAGEIPEVFLPSFRKRRVIGLK